MTLGDISHEIRLRLVERHGAYYDERALSPREWAWFKWIYRTQDWWRKRAR